MQKDTQPSQTRPGGRIIKKSSPISIWVIPLCLWGVWTWLGLIPTKRPRTNIDSAQEKPQSATTHNQSTQGHMRTQSKQNTKKSSFPTKPHRYFGAISYHRNLQLCNPFALCIQVSIRKALLETSVVPKGRIGVCFESSNGINSCVSYHLKACVWHSHLHLSSEGNQFVLQQRWTH